RCGRGRWPTPPPARRTRRAESTTTWPSLLGPSCRTPGTAPLVRKPCRRAFHHRGTGCRELASSGAHPATEVTTWVGKAATSGELTRHPRPLLPGAGLPESGNRTNPATARYGTHEPEPAMSTTRMIAAAQERRVTVVAEDGVALAVREYGPRDAELTVVLAHGHCLRTESWAQVRDALLREYAGARVVCYDHRGHGDSAAAPHRTYQLDRKSTRLNSSHVK